jgi:hypothetical protein
MEISKAVKAKIRAEINVIAAKAQKAHDDACTQVIKEIQELCERHGVALEDWQAPGEAEIKMFLDVPKIDGTTRQQMLFQFYLDYLNFYQHPSEIDPKVAKGAVGFAEYTLEHLPELFMAMRRRRQA